jgi:hypothetical protein
MNSALVAIGIETDAEIMDGLRGTDPVLRSRCAHVIGHLAQEDPTGKRIKKG